ncbi:hypothetical protein CAPTEDRAFT_209325 [Capitella teleta]|uniref:Uncharacterized protein n=1 Tax=Capitella teleta TaxID=283909 RepID=R7U3Q7_CAPTE|nr:hypothetical protein CAPTEDRAFT_209325 [Capitella teleta]|eukprot:ELU00960.1 hypothetical protein CAPTEDRAFT_209325 [Capitella teleta]
MEAECQHTMDELHKETNEFKEVADQMARNAAVIKRLRVEEEQEEADEEDAGRWTPAQKKRRLEIDARRQVFSFFTNLARQKATRLDFLHDKFMGIAAELNFTYDADDEDSDEEFRGDEHEMEQGKTKGEEEPMEDSAEEDDDLSSIEEALMTSEDEDL